MDIGRLILLLFFVLLFAILTIFLLRGRSRHEPDYRIHRGPGTFATLVGLIAGYLIFGNFGASILIAALLGAVAIGVGTWHEASHDARYGRHYLPDPYTTYTSGRPADLPNAEQARVNSRNYSGPTQFP